MLLTWGTNTYRRGKQKKLFRCMKNPSAMDRTQAYAPHLYYRMIVCCCRKNHTQGLFHWHKRLCNITRSVRHCLHSWHDLRKMNALFLAESAFLHCISLGEPPANLSFMNGCGTFRPHLALGMLYLKAGITAAR
jgi:hypothetical protein